MKPNFYIALSLVATLYALSGPTAVAQVPDAPAPPPEAAAPADAAPAPTAPTNPADAPPAPAAPAGGRQLLLPDISFIGSFVGHIGSDKRDPDRDRLRFEEGEIGIQSYIYPEIRADAFIVFGEDETVIEEGYLTVQNPLPGVPVSTVVGRRKVPFGRVNQLHPHSWLYVVQPYVLTNLVSGESLTGDGAYVSWLLPTGRTFAQLDAGFWSKSGHEHGDEHAEGEEEEHGDEIIAGSGAGIEDRFWTARLWTAMPALGGDLEIGGSYARGRGETVDVEDDAAEAFSLRGRQVEPGSYRPTVQLSGLDLTWRRSGRGASRFLLRSEYIRNRQKDGSFNRTADGYYVLADQRIDRQRSLALRYDWSEFPNEPGYHESAVSLIATHNLTEQSYLRAQLIHGDRPGKSGFNEVWFQWVWGMGPHTHKLE